MREILFRGKTILDNEWVIGAGVYKSEGHAWIITDDVTKTENRGTGSDAIIPETVGQYTGLTDKNGKKIFEGDIVDFKTSAYYFKNCRIKYQSYYGRYCAMDNEGYEYPMDKNFEYEVIGNIHDNPELLEVEK